MATKKQLEDRIASLQNTIADLETTPGGGIISTPDELQAALKESLKQLSGDVRFKVFMRSLQSLREFAIREACADSNVESPTKMAASLGEIRAYTDIFNVVDEHKARPGAE